MKRLVDDALSTRPLSVIFYRLGGSGQIQRHRFSHECMVKIAVSGAWMFIVFAWGLWTGWMMWGGR